MLTKRVLTLSDCLKPYYGVLLALVWVILGTSSSLAALVGPPSPAQPTSQTKPAAKVVKPYETTTPASLAPLPQTFPSKPLVPGSSSTDPTEAKLDTESIELSTEADTASQLPPVNALQKLPPFIQLSPYRPTHYELNLWRIEANLFVRSPVVLSPDGAGLAYTEAIYQPGFRQVTGQLYWVPIETMPAYDPVQAFKQPQLADPKRWLSFLDSNLSHQQRELLWRAGGVDQKLDAFGFQTLTVVDWSASGQRLLVKRRVGVLYTGLRDSLAAVYDRASGEIIQFGEIGRAVQVYWANKLGRGHELFSKAWQLEPIGWEPGSDTRFYVEGWSYSQNQKQQYLGLWLYDLELQQTSLVSEAEKKTRLASNGYRVKLNPAMIPEPYHSQYAPVEATKKPPSRWQRFTEKAVGKWFNPVGEP